MLVLSRKLEESILIDGDVRIKVLEIRGGQVRLGIDAPRSVNIVRSELVPKESIHRSSDSVHQPTPHSSRVKAAV